MTEVPAIDDRQLSGRLTVSCAVMASASWYVPSALKVTVPLTLLESTVNVSPLQEAPCDVVDPDSHDEVTFQVPTMLPPQPDVLPQLPPPELLLHALTVNRTAPAKAVNPRRTFGMRPPS